MYRYGSTRNNKHCGDVLIDIVQVQLFLLMTSFFALCLLLSVFGCPHSTYDRNAIITLPVH